MSILTACSGQTDDNDQPAGGDNNKTDKNSLIVDAGSDLDYSATGYEPTVNLNGTVTDPEGQAGEIRLQWSLVDGPSTAQQQVVIDDPSAASTVAYLGAFVEPSASFTFRLSAENSEGDTGFDDIVFTVPKPQLSVDARDVVVNSAGMVNLHAVPDFQGADDRLNYQWQWQQISGPTVSPLNGVNSADLQFTAPAISTRTTLQFAVTVSTTVGDTTETDQDTVLVTVNPAGSPPNSPPTANAGPDISVRSGVTVTLNGSGADSDGQVVSYQWEQLSNGTPVVQLNNANTANVTFTVPTVSNGVTVSLILTVTDNLGAMGNDRVNIRINPNTPPSANAGGDISVVSGAPVQIQGTGADSDGSVASYAWTRVSGPAVTLNNANSATVSFTAPNVASATPLTLQLTVTDNEGATGSDEVVITVLPANSNQPPAVNAGQDRLVNSGEPVTLNAVATDDGSVSAYLWTNQTIGGPAITLANARTASVSFTAPAVIQRTLLTLRVTVTDNQNASASDDVIITVNASPVANAGTDQTVTAGTVVNLTGSGSDVDGSVAAYQWTQSGTPQVTLTNAQSAAARFTAPQVAQTTTLTFRLNVTDNDGATADDTVSVTVNPQAVVNQPPLALAGDDQAVHAGDVVTLSGSGQDSDGTIAAYRWEHTPGQTQEPVINIANPGAQTVQFTAPSVTEPTALTFTLTVTDNTGATGTDSVVVTVNPLVSLSGTITAASATLIDSDSNAQGVEPVVNNPYSNFQHLPNPATVGGYVHQQGVGPAGSNSGIGDSEDVYHVSLLPGQVVSLYLGESYFDPTTDSSNPTQPIIHLFLTNDYDVPADNVIYGWASGSSGVLSVTVPNRNDLPADGHYYISILAGAASAYSYVLTVGSASPVQTQTSSLSTDLEFVPGELIVEFADAETGVVQPMSLGQRAAALGMQALGGAPGRNILLGLGDAAGKSRAFAALGLATQAAPAAADAVLQAKIDTIRAAVAMQQRPDVKSVSLNYIYRPTAVPNDALYGRQWHYPLINLPQAWDITTGSSEVTVAVIDTGILPNHPDIDANRLVDGYDFIRDPQNARDGDGIDPNPVDNGDGGAGRTSSFHGTHVAGTIAANTNNGIGVAGVAWGVNIMPLRVLGVNGGTQYDIEQAIRYAAQLPNDSNRVPSRRADVINLSLGGPTSSTSAPQAYRLARQAGVIIIAAAGNDGSSQPSAPAAYNGVVSVSAVTINRQRASYSNFGSTIDVAAPGGNYSDSNGDGLPDAVWSTRASDAGTQLQYTYDYAAGTSMASPHVAGVVALMKSVYPELTPDVFDSMLANGELTVDLGSPGRDNNFGYGLIDAQKAVTAALNAGGVTPPPPDPPVLSVTPAALNFGSQLSTIEISLSNAGAGTLTVSTINQDSGGWLSVVPVTVDAQGLGVYAINVARAGLAQGLYSATVRVNSNGGSVDIPVSMQVFAMTVINDAGPQVVELVDALSQEVVQSQRVLTDNGVYQYSFGNVRFGVYRIRSSSDLDNDGTLCELGESCGAYPTLDSTVSSEIQVDGGSFDINNLDFETGFHINVIAQ